MAAIGVPKLKRRRVGQVEDFRAFAPGYFLLIENNMAMRISADILNEAKRLGHTMVHVKTTAAHFHAADFDAAIADVGLERIPYSDPEPDDKYRSRLLDSSKIADRAALLVASGVQLDAIGKVYGFIRGGFREET